MTWFQVVEPDTPMSINPHAIAYIVKEGKGCRIRTIDGTDHNFFVVSYEDMLKKLQAVNN